MSNRAYSIGLLLLCFVVALVLWDWLYPVNVFVVVLHEWCHGLAAILTGGSVGQIYIDVRAGGWCSHNSSWRFVTAAAGYVGSPILGALILLAAAGTRRDRAISMFLGAFLIVLSALYVRNTFGLAFCVAFGLLLIASGRWLPEAVNDFILRFLGMSSCLYSVVDLKRSLMAHWGGWRPNTGNAELDRIWSSSDADTLAALTGIPATVWWGLFLLLGVGTFAVAAWLSVKWESGWSAKDGAPGAG
ncbi:MAG: M50 family metallopeptidase [Candidatus Riflebacteria bacterium]|nr:M50 family metallopeptidase [Candidatus Riflebacteria bacterium]